MPNIQQREELHRTIWSMADEVPVIFEGIQLVSVTHDIKFEAPNGKLRATDALDSDGV